MQANCVYVVFNIKSDIAAAQQPYIGNDFMLNQFAVCKRSMLHFNPLIFFPGKNQSGYCGFQLVISSSLGTWSGPSE